MPISAAQLANGANYQLQSYTENDPIDQFTVAQPLTKWLIDNKKPVVFSNGIFNEKVAISNSSNYQNFAYDDQVTYNTKDTVRLAPFQHYEAHDGFALTETDLANNGIVMVDNENAVASVDEMQQIVNRLEENYLRLKNGFQFNFDQEMHRDGTQNAKACPGLDNLVSTTPAVGTVGGIDASVNLYWRNQINLSINTGTVGNLTQAMEKSWRDCMTVGGKAPDMILMGSKAFDAYRNDAPLAVNRQLWLNKPGSDAKGGFRVDNGAQGDGQTSGVYFKGVEVMWDPVFDVLQSLLAPTIPWDKRIYFLNSKTLRLRPYKGRWMIKRNPPRIYDRYTHYFGLTADYGLTINQRNNLAVLSIA